MPLYLNKDGTKLASCLLDADLRFTLVMPISPTCHQTAGMYWSVFGQLSLFIYQHPSHHAILHIYIMTLPRPSITIPGALEMGNLTYLRVLEILMYSLLRGFV